MKYKYSGKRFAGLLILVLLIGGLSGYSLLPAKVIETTSVEYVDVPVIEYLDKIVEVEVEKVVEVLDPKYDWYSDKYEVAEACYNYFSAEWQEELTINGTDYDDWVESNNQKLELRDEPDFEDVHDVLSYINLDLIDLEDNEYDCSWQAVLRDEDRNEYLVNATVVYEDGDLDDLIVIG